MSIHGNPHVLGTSGIEVGAVGIGCNAFGTRIDADQEQIGIPRQLFFDFAPFVGSAGQQTGADAAIRAAGLQNAMQGFIRYQPLSQEGVIASRPDLVVISQDGINALGGEAKLWTLPGLAQTPAGRNKQVLAIDDMALLGFSVRTPEAIRQLRTKAEQLP